MVHFKQPAKRLLSLFLAFTMILSMVIVGAGAAESVGPDLRGSGTERDPYLIGSVDDLITLQQYVNGGGGSQVYRYYRQTADLDLSGIENWMPIGSEHREGSVLYVDYRFSGVYDGDGHSITGMTITTSKTVGTNTEGFGLFGHISNATIKDLTVSGTINHTKISGNSAKYGIGGIAGLAIGLYSDDPNELNAYSNCFITGCTSNVVINAQGLAVGGILGGTEVDTSFENCEFNGSITVAGLTSTYGYESYGAGGILGSSEANDQFVGCVNNGTITASNASEINMGGIVGWLGNGATTMVDSCVNTGALTADHTSVSDGVGGIIGKRSNGYGGTESEAVFITNCYNTGTLTAQDDGSTGGILGRAVTVDVYGYSIWAEGTLENLYVKSGTADYLIRSVETSETVREGDYSSETVGTFTSLSELADKMGDRFALVNGEPVLTWEAADTRYDVEFVFYDSTTGEELSAYVDLEYENGLTAGRYRYTARKSGYTPVSGDFAVVRSDKTVYVALTPGMFSYTLTVTPADAALTVSYANTNGGAVMVPPTTVNGGSYTFDLNSYIYGDYGYTLRCFGYVPDSGALEVYSDGTQALSLTEAERYAVSFQVCDPNGDEVTAREITVTSDDYQCIVSANTDGTYSLPAGDYTAVVKAEGYLNGTYAFVVSADAVIPVTLSDNIWDGVSVDTSWYDANATEYYIYDAAELAGLASLTNAGTDSFSGKTIYICSDMDLGTMPWTPISASSVNQAFRGTLNGQGHTITGLLLNGSYNQALIGYTNGAAISDLTVMAVDNRETATEDENAVPAPGYRSAILVSSAVSTGFTNIRTDGTLYASGNVVGGIVGEANLCTFTSCENDADVYGTYQVGGLVGVLNNGVSGFIGCANYGAVTGTYTQAYVSEPASLGVGGLIGYVNTPSPTIDRCVNLGSVTANSNVGGIVGSTASARTVSITNCYNAGEITISNTQVILQAATYDDEGNEVPAVMGTQDGLYAAGILGCSVNDVTLESCYNRGTITDQSEANEVAPVAGLTGEGSTLKNNYYLAQETGTDGAFVQAEEYSALIAALGSAYTADTGINGGFPILKWQDGSSTFAVKFSLGYDTTVNQGEDAVITVSGETITGTTVALPVGTYSYTVSQRGYKTVSGSFTVAGDDLTIPVTLTAEKYTYTFTTNGAIILKQGETVVEPLLVADGVYTYALYNGTYTYTATKTNCTTQTDTITVNYGGGSKTLTLVEAATYGVTFNVTCGGEAFDGWTAEIFTSEGVSAGAYGSGDAIRLMSGTYTYTLRAVGYQEESGRFTVADADVTVPASMSKVVAAPWDGSADTSWYAGESPYYISTAEQLAGLAQLVNNGTSFAGADIYLLNDLDLGDKEWTPIGGNYAKPFRGSFHGNGHTITTQGSYAVTERNIGLFGYADGAAFENIILSGNVTVNMTVTGSGYPAPYIGGLIGWAEGATVTNAANRMSLTVSLTSSVYVAPCVGGLVGNLSSSLLTACNNTGSISATVDGTSTYMYAGGLTGYAFAASGKSGGFDSCYNAGDVTADAGMAAYAGGLVGRGYFNSSSTVTLTKNYAVGAAAAKTAADALIADCSITVGEDNFYLDTLTSEFGTAKSADAMRSEAFATSLGDHFRYIAGVYPLNDWEAVAEKLEVQTLPTKTAYKDQESFDDTGMVLAVTYNSGVTQTITSGWTVLDGGSLTVGQTWVTVSFLGAKTTVPITVEQTVHPITSDDLSFTLDTLGAELVLTNAQSAKFSAGVQWTQGGSPTSAFRDNTYYRANVTLTAVYETDGAYYNFDAAAVPAVQGAYEILNKTVSSDGRTMTFTVTYEVSDSLTDEASHLYHEGEEGYAAALAGTVTVTIDGTDTTYTVRELEQFALEGAGVEQDGFTGLSLYALLNRDGALTLASDSDTVTVGAVVLTLGDLRADAGNACLLVYGQDGAPLTAPIALVKAGEILVEGVSAITVEYAKPATFTAAFTAEEAVTAQLTITDAYGNVVYTGGLGTVTLGSGGVYTYVVEISGYAAQSGTIDRACHVTVPLIPAWNGTYVQPAVDEDGTYLIGTAEELAWFNYQSTRVSADRATELAAANVRLTADICMAGYPWVPIGSRQSAKTLYLSTGTVYSGGYYAGTFDGNGHTIYDLTISHENEYSAADVRLEGFGLFGCARGATIRDLGVEGTISVLDRAYYSFEWRHIGGIVGFASSATTISGCYVNMEIETTIDPTKPTACDAYVGGIVGSITLGTTVENCYSLGTIYAESTGCLDIGGIVGSDRISSSTLGGNTVSKCYSTMDLTAVPSGYAAYIGGIVGEVSGIAQNDIPNISYCFALNGVLDGGNGSELYAGRLVGNGDKFQLAGIYNYALETMVIQNAMIGEYDVDDSGYRSSWGRDITAERAYTETAYTNVLWNYGEYDEETGEYPETNIWSFDGEQSYPRFVWQSTSVVYGETIRITVTDMTAQTAVIDEPDGGWMEGSNTFTVQSGAACIVLVGDAENGYTRLTATATDEANTYRFTVENMTEDTTITVLLAGDANSDGEVNSQDLLRMQAAFLGKDGAALNAVQIFAADLSGDGKVNSLDILRALAVSLGLNTLDW